MNMTQMGFAVPTTSFNVVFQMAHMYKYYIDGGIYQNCPIDMFLRDGYDEVYVIRNWISRKLKYDKKSKTKINVITPEDKKIKTINPIRITLECLKDFHTSFSNFFIIT